MIVRRATVALAAALALAGCSTFSSNDAAADVAGTEVPREEFEEVLSALTANSEVSQIVEDLDTNTVTGDDGRGVLGFMIRTAAGSAFVADAGQPITDADREAVRATIPPGSAASQYPESVVALLVEQQALGAALGRVAAADDLQRRYEESPAGVGVMCVSHIVVATEEEAVAVAEELAAGADFAELAGERSIEPDAAETGGALELQAGQPCATIEQAQGSIDQAQGSIDAEFLAGAMAAVPGTPTDPMQSSVGWHVVVARPYEEVGDAVAAVVGQQLFADHMASIDVSVDPRYGQWNAATTTVEPVVAGNAS